jgi:hypothetical protein
METRLLRRVIHYIWECFQIEDEMKLRLRNVRGDELHVEESAAESRVIVRYFAKQPSDELVKQMEIVCFIMHYGQWVPVELYEGGIAKSYGTSDGETGRIDIADKRGQAIAVGFCDAWALQFLEQGFLASAAKLVPLGVKPSRRPQWPQPTVPTPDLEQIEDWLWDDGGCEATDGCWIEPDGICPHGHPSWFLRLGLI